MVGSLDKNFPQITRDPMVFVNKNLTGANAFISVKPPQDDEILPSSIFTNLKVSARQAVKLPEYAYRGLKGDPDANFYESLQLSKIPYYLGGPVLIWTFKSGEGHPLRLTKQKAAGVLLYYLGIMAANEAINIPIKLIRGVDLNQKYLDIVDIRPITPEGNVNRKVEYHNVFESIDFTRWDLLYDRTQKANDNPKLINQNYDRIAKKMGLGENLADSDSATQPYIKKLIVMSKAWKYFMAVPFVAMAIGLSSQDAWLSWRFSDLKKGIKLAFSKKPQSLGTLKKAKITSSELIKALKESTYSPLKLSFIDFWTGKNLNGLARHTGKITIVSAIASVLVANFTILRAAQGKNKGPKTSAEAAIQERGTN